MARYTRRPYKKRNTTYRRLKKGYQTGGMWGLAKKAATGVVKYYLNPEYKFLDYTTAASPITPSSAGTVIANPCLVALGDTSTDRNGNSIKITSILLRATIAKHASAPSTRVRVIMFSDVSSAGAIPSIGSVLQTITNDDGVISPMNRLNGSRFRIWMDKTYTMDTDSPTKGINSFRKCSHHIKYLDGTAAATSLGQGPIYLAFISDQSANLPTVELYTRMRFLDN